MKSPTTSAPKQESFIASLTILIALAVLFFTVGINPGELAQLSAKKENCICDQSGRTCNCYPQFYVFSASASTGMVFVWCSLFVLAKELPYSLVLWAGLSLAWLTYWLALRAIIPTRDSYFWIWTCLASNFFLYTPLAVKILFPSCWEKFVTLTKVTIWVWIWGKAKASWMWIKQSFMQLQTMIITAPATT